MIKGAMIEAVVFDFGGVIVDLDFEKAVAAFESIGVADASQRLDRYRQTGLFFDLEAGRISKAEFCRLLGEECGCEITERDAMYGCLGYFNGVDARRLELLDELRERCRVFLLSNTNPFVLDWADSAAFSAEGRPVSDYFDALYLSYRIGVLKPDRAIFDRMTADAGLVPERTLFVDDSADNVAAARALGFRVYCPKPGEDWRDEVLRLVETL